jgi:large subunit ribosomal protein L29
MRASQLRELTTSELYHRLDEAKQALFNLRFQRAADRLEDHNRLVAAKRDVARLLTVLRERQIAEQQASEGQQDE